MDRNKNIIYSCYTPPKSGVLPAFVHLHRHLAEQYAKKIGCEYKCIDKITTKYEPLSFVVYEAYKDFAESDYDNMLYIDWDVMISRNSPDIFNEFKNCDFAAYRWRDSYTSEPVEVSNIEEFIKHSYSEETYSGTEGPPCDENEAFVYFMKYCCGKNPTGEILTTYLNEECSGGVMLLSRKAMRQMLYGQSSRKNTWEYLYDRLCEINNNQTDNKEIKMLKSVLITQSKYVIDYLRINNNIRFEKTFSKKWNSNSVIGNMTKSDYFFNFNGACAVDTNSSILSQKELACYRFARDNVELFFESKKQFLAFCKKHLTLKHFLEIYEKHNI